MILVFEMGFFRLVLLWLTVFSFGEMVSANVRTVGALTITVGAPPSPASPAGPVEAPAGSTGYSFKINTQASRQRLSH